ncbi:uncharacterized protein LOC112573109 isoform X2 [Pomacea canaliculata]|nr:uncharacterized protein LOC112573109 isoform X2 [Pomacea canaliculata]XP_025108934.1 uncharacterized protein LOC112573109 isoform X2 [Pomacea canaliculata]XP_025108936.1 uncharacterized protein LOC112573109 isoform X2 [Pomacea canaliculata]XP_025108937.1 uncharacterized protein LOC112573109 isoform X2 [Pomacea canaliculata]XP_025108938.1 uncharacterized protein LOC112573109 isoform X2 [Pomacea canaliculata]XP_025108939.1 uncharacterized protein LOC112573109 isoform X2 [Pomacea canaliculata]
MSSNWNSQTSMTVGGYQVFQSQPVSMDDKDQPGLIPAVEVKTEPVDNGYEQIGEPRICNVTSLQNAHSQTVEDLWTGTFRAEIREILGNKSTDQNATVQNVQDVVEKLLKKNEDLLSQNDAIGFKPNRRGRLPAEMARKTEAFPGIGQTAAFSTGLGQRGRVMPSGSIRERDDGIPMGRILRPRTPTLRCHMVEKDKSHFTSAVMETKIGSKESEEIFHVQEHEMVCGVSANTQLLSREGRLMALVDIKRYWCNFCSFSTSNKNQLITHIMDHRFHCKYCRYQSFSRADVIQHSFHTHPEFQEMASLMQYCTLLSDYLRVQNPNTARLDNRPKRKDGTEKGNNGGSHEEENPAKLRKLDDSQIKGQSTDTDMKLAGSLTSDYDIFDMEVDNTSESTEETEKETPLLPAFATVQSSIASNPVSFTPAVIVQTTRVASPAVISGPVITQVFSAGSPQPDETGSCILGSTSRSILSSTMSSPSPSPSSASTSSMQPMRSNLYWNCGYCPFTSKSQSEVKDHSGREHIGKAHRYVALIKAEDSSSPAPSSSSGREGGRSGSSSRKKMSVGDKHEEGRLEEAGEQEGETELEEEKQLSISRKESSDKDEKLSCSGLDAEGSVQSTSQGNANPEISAETGGFDQVVIKQEPVDAEEQIIPMKVCFPKPRIQAKENTAIKCCHCNYSARMLSHLRNHIVYCHKGKQLMGTGAMNSKVFMCARSDCTFRSSSGTTFLNHAILCTPWTKSTISDLKIDGHLLASLEKTKALAKESASGKAVRDEATKD